MYTNIYTDTRKIGTLYSHPHVFFTTLIDILVFIYEKQ